MKKVYGVEHVSYDYDDQFYTPSENWSNLNKVFTKKVDAEKLAKETNRKWVKETLAVDGLHYMTRNGYEFDRGAVWDIIEKHVRNVDYGIWLEDNCRMPTGLPVKALDALIKLGGVFEYARVVTMEMEEA